MLLSGRNINCFMIISDKTISALGLFDNLKIQTAKHNIKCIVYDNTRQNPTIDNAEEALQIYLDNNCKALVGFGGGSAIDCAKAVAARVAKPKKTLIKMKGLFKVLKKTPLTIAIPTTSGTGSEATVACVMTDSRNHHKYAINDLSLIPHYALLDPGLSLGLPKQITATTGMDALTHAVEAYIGHSLTRKTKKCAIEAVKLIIDNILIAYNQPDNLAARSAMQRASYLAGVAFTRSYVGNIHALSHAVSGKYQTPHGLANAVLLPRVLEYYGKKSAKKLSNLAKIAKISNSKDNNVNAKAFVDLIYKMNDDMNIGKKLNVNPDDFAMLSKFAEKEANPLYPVPKIFCREDFIQILKEVQT